MAVELDRWERLFAARTRGVGEGITAILALANVRDIVSFAGGLPDPATFPGEAIGEVFSSLIGDSTAFQYAPTAGLPGMRRLVSDRIERFQGARPDDGELLITSGGIEALELAGKAFVDRGDLAVVEGPCYLGAIMAFRSFEARVEAVPMDADGMQVDALEPLRPKLVYTIPDHQNPAGVSLSADRRRALVELARRNGFVLLEDVAYRDISFDAEPPPTLWSLAPDVVVQFGTFSKTFFPGVRLGWAVGPPEVIAQLVSAKQNTDQCAGALGQRLLEEYERRGHLDEQIARARRLYARRCALMMDALERHFAGRAEWTRPRGGFFTWVTFAEEVDSLELAKRALDEAQVALVPGTVFYPDGRGVHEARLAFSNVRDDDIDVGIERLAALIP